MARSFGSFMLFHLSSTCTELGIPLNLRWGRCKFEKVLQRCQNYRFFDILWDIINKMKDNLGQKCVNGGLLGQKWNNCL